MEDYSSHGSYFKTRRFSKEDAANILPSLYDSNGQTHDFSSFEYYNDACVGQCSYPFINKEKTELIKMYLRDCPDRYRISLKMFEKFKYSDIPYIVPLEDYFYYDNPISRFKSIDAYTMKFISGQMVSLFSLSYDEFLYLVERLEETLIALSKERIVVGDLKYQNILFFKDKVYLIDLDCYRDSFLPQKIVYSYNKRKLLECINSILKYQSFRTKEKTISCFIKDIPFGNFTCCVEKSLGGDSPYELCNKIISGEKSF